MAKTFNPQDLIPEYWYGINVPTEEDLIFLGTKNLEYLKQYWRHKERELAGWIKTSQSYIDTLEGKTIEDIKAMASGYEHPKFPEIGISNIPHSWAHEPEPLDEESIDRKPGTTTFNFCGWCEYAANGICRFGYHIICSCALLPNRRRDEEFRFNTPCVIANGNQELLDSAVEHLKSKLAGLIGRKTKIGEYIRFIANAMKNAEEKPYLASHRPSKWFEIGDEVVVFISNDFENARKKGVFVTGKVVNGYRHGEGCVSIRADEQVHTGGWRRGHGLGYGLCRPEIMKRWEYEYFKTHPDYLEVWLRASADLTEFDSEQLAEAFANPNL